MNKLRLVLILQLALFALWACWLLAFSSRTVAEFYLNTAPVDPRNLLSGTYLALAYDISQPKGTDCESVLNAATRTAIHVQLGPSGATVNAGGRELPVYSAQACSAEKPAADGKTWVSGKKKLRWGRQVDYGIEKFYISENNPLKDARSGEFAARVQLDGLGNLRLMDLVKK